ncbi:hypothetical protein BOTCAL_0147g00110 [Botryotinia calthae]|uniref:DUF7730 domain-containing protein n=1 Tax=Botryotinia calthae TaxID=38488 RepID=A0A4Y8D2M2_9HELO|nr:hypothetical protein BOTCAL_0147g00110 [Botryotinia calthae]
METNAPQVNQPSPLFETRELAVCFGIQSYLHMVKNRFQDEPQIYEDFIETIQNFQEDEETSREDFKVAIGEILEGHDDLIQEYHRVRILFDEREPFELAREQIEEGEEAREKKEALRKIASAERQAAHIRACEAQSESALLHLPREIRDTIWKDVVQGNIVHISRVDDTSSSTVTPSSYKYHSCVATKGLKSSACPSGEGDHALCARTSRSDFPSYRLVCKQMNLELPDARETFFAKNALHFDNLLDAEEFLFGLEECDRAAITHLRLPVPYSLAMKSYAEGIEFSAWEAIMNYFSCPWARETLHFDDDNSMFLKLPWYFYYSSCYYYHNSDRMYKKWQVGFGNTSWDVDIASLRYKSEPRMDIGMNYPESAQTTLFRPRPHHHIPFTTQFHNPPPWLRSLLQFRQYSGLNFHFWAFNPTSQGHGIVRVPRHEAFIEALQEEVSHSEIGPWKLVEFRGAPFGNPDGCSLRNL